MLRNRKSVFLTLWLSYIVILIIPVSFSAVMYTRMESRLIGNASRSNLAMLEQVRQVADNHLMDIDQLVVQIATHPKLQTMWTIEESGKYIQYQEAVQALKNIRSGTGFVDDFFIHLRQQDVILTPSMKTDTNLYFNNLYMFPGMSMSRIRSELLGDYHFKTFWPVQQLKVDASMKNVILCAVSLPLGDERHIWGTLVMMIEDRQFFDLLKQIEWVNSGAMFILDEHDRVILSTSGGGRLPEGLREEWFRSGSGYKKDASDLISYTTGKSGWKYISVVPERVVLARVNDIKLWALVLLGLAVGAGTLAAYWMAYRSYSPIKDMMIALMKGKNAEKPAQLNEYEFIKTSIAQTLADSREAKEQLDEYIPVVRAYFLSRLLKGQAEPAALTKESLAFMGIRLPHEEVRVMLIELDESGELLRDGGEWDWALVRFLFNVSSEFIGESGYAAEMELNRLALLLSVPASGENLGELVDSLKRVVEERFQMKIAIGISSVRSGLREASRCYTEAASALDYRIIHGSDSVIYYEQIDRTGRGYYDYPMEIESQLINYMKSGARDDALRLLDELYETNMGSGAITPEMGKALFFDLLSTMLKVIHALKLGEEQLPSAVRDPAKFVAAGKSAEDMLGRLKSLCRAVCDSVLEAKSDQKDRLNENLKQYIADNLAHNGLSLTAIAGHFGMTPQYISGFFKKQNGVNLTDYITEIRIRHAKRLLAGSELSVLQVALQVGYATDIGFIRVFKKLEGITPGKYRETARQGGRLKNG
ncbi:helix-turn-helix domain-containing protein [Cohnella sp. JJ-181]|uniref:helix-turn-helix domain-containing protein n=1 Tax=Cohnella rhizoplanae TaxID=2974897 RepID=UPI0022FFC23F|nr:helix-turn-helix domain-containing protein [Cohnella sp. JJ-181]CAI6085668.1 HTH-type transcriptional activator RhaR [Cohnella sp. JJ-181]